MSKRTPRLLQLTSAVLALWGALAIAGPAVARDDEITEWNVIAIEVLALGGQNPVVMTRGLAMAHLAAHDALNAIDRRYEPYLHDARAEPGAAAEAAVPVAMHDVLVGALIGFGTAEQQARAKDRADAALVTFLARIPDGRAKRDGIAVGQ